MLPTRWTSYGKSKKSVYTLKIYCTDEITTVNNTASLIVITPSNGNRRKIPIVSSIRSPTYDISRFLARELQLLIGRTKLHVTNSMDFIRKIQKIRLHPEDILVSFDVLRVTLHKCPNKRHCRYYKNLSYSPK
ncbi:PREDICTED: uncharacterized protein LOC108781673 [Cyphomyrmex costatus]|uniref:uncharacterized protein LOC108781673 n=1 Tax=Cyphomyrmex costatus TaxID=456900 RepID=UPI00085242DB|nr:PREDICTED: uncharacterized protein LOC108781673 [Cyphomyrmex costatus]